MGQGFTGASVTYARLKDIMSGFVPALYLEPPLGDIDLTNVVFDIFQDDDFGKATTFEALVDWLHNHYFPRLAWASLT